MGIKIKLVKSFSGSSDKHQRTIDGLGLKKFGQERLLRDTPAIRGMLFKVKHLVTSEIVADEPVVKPRRKPRKTLLREAARAAEAKAP